MADFFHGFAALLYVKHGTHMPHSDAALSASKASSATGANPSTETNHEFTPDDDTGAEQGTGPEQIGEDVANNGSEGAEDAQNAVRARGAVKDNSSKKTNPQRISQLAKKLQSVVAIRPDAHINEASIWERISNSGLLDPCVNLLDPDILEKHPDILLFDRLIKIQNLETAREEHNRYETDLIEKT